MNQARIWCVVSPNVGLPLLLGSVAVTSLIVHASVMTHTTWMGNFWQGAAKAKSAEATPTGTGQVAAATPAPGVTVSVSPVAGADGKFLVTVSPAATDAPTQTAAN